MGGAGRRSLLVSVGRNNDEEREKHNPHAPVQWRNHCERYGRSPHPRGSPPLHFPRSESASLSNAPARSPALSSHCARWRVPLLLAGCGRVGRGERAGRAAEGRARGQRGWRGAKQRRSHGQHTLGLATTRTPGRSSAARAEEEDCTQIQYNQHVSLRFALLPYFRHRLHWAPSRLRDRWGQPREAERGLPLVVIAQMLADELQWGDRARGVRATLAGPR